MIDKNTMLQLIVHKKMTDCGCYYIGGCHPNIRKYIEERPININDVFNLNGLWFLYLFKHKIIKINE